MLDLNVSNVNNSPNKLYGKFSNSSLDSNKAFLTNAYGKDQFYSTTKNVQYYNDSKNPENVKKKRSKAKVALISGSVFVGTAFSLIALSRGKKVNFNSLKDYGAKIANESLTFVDKAKNAMENCTNMKDDLADRVFFSKFENVPVLKYINIGANKLKNVYLDTVKKTIGKKFNLYFGELMQKYEPKDIPENLKDVKFNQIYEELNSKISESLSGDNRITKGLIEGNNIKEKAQSLVKNMTCANRANFKMDENGVDEIIKKYLIKLPEGLSEAELKKTPEFKYNELIKDTMVAKLRDIHCGSAPTDVLTSGAPLIAFGLGLANADSKEEQKNIAIEVGIPLLSTVSMPFVGLLFPILSGFKGIVAGLAAGFVLKIPAKAIMKVANKSDSKEIKA